MLGGSGTQRIYWQMPTAHTCVFVVQTTRMSYNAHYSSYYGRYTHLDGTFRFKHTCTMVAYLAGGKYRVYRSPRDASILDSAELSSASVMPLAASCSQLWRNEYNKKPRTLGSAEMFMFTRLWQHHCVAESYVGRYFAVRVRLVLPCRANSLRHSRRNAAVSISTGL